MRVEGDGVVSVPGKTLVSGGYAVLCEGGVGLAVAVDARFYCAVGRGGDGLRLRNPQLPGADWEGHGSGPTAFLDELFAVVEGFAAFLGRPLAPATFTLCFDARFLSPSEPTTGEVKLGDRRFPRFAAGLERVRKTGLGSSACAVVAIVGAALHALGAAEPATVFWLSFYAVSAAQGGVGSGFDVSTAVFGSQLFAAVASAAREEVFAALRSRNFDRFCVLAQSVDCPATPLRLGGLRLAFRDFGLGSRSPALAREVLACLRDEPDFCRAFVERLNAVTRALAAQLTAPQPCPRALRSVNDAHRALVAELGRRSGAPVEPATLGAALDSALAAPAPPLYAICPGAGGFDALLLLLAAGTAPQPTDGLFLCAASE